MEHTRECEIRDGKVWVDIRFDLLKKGDVFRLWDVTDGQRYALVACAGCGATTMKAFNAPHQREDGVWAVDAQFIGKPCGHGSHI